MYGLVPCWQSDVAQRADLVFLYLTISSHGLPTLPILVAGLDGDSGGGIEGGEGGGWRKVTRRYGICNIGTLHNE